MGLVYTSTGEALALAELVRRENGGRRRNRMRQAEPLGDPRRHGHGPVGSRRDDAVEVERGGEALDRGLVLGRDDAAAVGEPEAGRGGIAVGDRSPDAVRPRRLEQPELCGACS